MVCVNTHTTLADIVTRHNVSGEPEYEVANSGSREHILGEMNGSCEKLTFIELS